MELQGKFKLLDKIVHDPLSVSRQNVFYWASIENDSAINFDDLRKLMLKVFDQNEKSLLKASDASLGTMGFANAKSTKYRQKRFVQKINDGFRKDGNKIIVAEGDSWFQFPFFVSDIVDHLIATHDCAVYSMASGGDWLANIIYDGKYIENLSLIAPDAFLMSGGGNDLVGSFRLACMIDLNPCYEHKYAKAEDIVTKNEYIHQGNLKLLQPYDSSMVLKAQPFIKKEFYSFLWIIYIQFYLIFQNFMRSNKHKNMFILTQGYDYAIPYRFARFDWRCPLQPLINIFVGSSKWLYTPLMLKGITDAGLQKAIIHAFIFEFNLKLMDLVLQPEFPNVIHIDCRGTAASHNDWFDELHLKSHVFKKIADVMHHCIQSYGRTTSEPGKAVQVTGKIVKVKDYIK